MFDKILVMFNLFAAEIPDYWVNKMADGVIVFILIAVIKQGFSSKKQRSC